MPEGLGNSIFKAVTSVPAIHRWINRRVVSAFADGGALPGRFTTKDRGNTTLWELLDKDYFALELPTPPQAEIDSLPDLDDVMALFERKGPAPESRVSLLLPFFAQHLTDAVFQSDRAYETDAPHEIILNQIYGNTSADEAALRQGSDGKLQTQTRTVNGNAVTYPDALFEANGDDWVVKDRYAQLSYLQKPGKVEELLEKYKGREGDVCATGLFQGNLTLGNFAITALMVREHNRVCDGILAERAGTDLSTDDQSVFRLAQQITTTAYMKVVIEDYINAFAGQKLFILDTQTFWHEEKRWCRETPIPYHFNTLYRIHAMIPDHLTGYEDQGFAALLANNNLVMEKGLGAIFELASSQGAGQVSLGNTHPKLLPADRAGVDKARHVLASFSAHRRAQKAGSAGGFGAFDPRFRDALKTLYGQANRVEYAVGILAEEPKLGWMERLGLKDPPIIGPTLMNAIAKHAFRHILSNRFMTREFLNRRVLGQFGWRTIHATSSVADIVKRNVSGEMDQASANALRVSFANPNPPRS